MRTLPLGRGGVDGRRLSVKNVSNAASSSRVLLRGIQVSGSGDGDMLGVNGLPTSHKDPTSVTSNCAMA